MKIIKLALISIVVFFLLLTAFSSLLPNHITISRAVDITAGPAETVLQINDLRQWKRWNNYVKSFPDEAFSQDSISGPKLTITKKLADDSLVLTNWRQNNKLFPGGFRLVPQQSITTVQWYFEFNLHWYPWEKFGSIIYDKQLGPEMEQSLIRLKQLLEKAP